MDVVVMRRLLLQHFRYASGAFITNLKKMPDYQVIAIYMRLKKEGKLV